MAAGVQEFKGNAVELRKRKECATKKIIVVVVIVVLAVAALAVAVVYPLVKGNRA